MDADVLYAQLYRVDTTDNATMRTGIVRAVDAIKGTIDVEVAGELLREIPYGGGLSPIVGESVWLIEQGNWFAAISASANTGQYAGIDEVVVGDEPPTASAVDLWMDTNNVGEGDGWTVLDERYVNADGDVMTGTLSVLPESGAGIISIASTNSYAELRVDSANAAASTGVVLQKSGTNRWKISAGPTTDELLVARYNDSGVYVDTPFRLSQDTGVANFSWQPTVSAPQSEADLSMQGGWAHYGGGFGNCMVTRFGPVVTMNGLPKRTSDFTPVANTAYTIGVIPVGFRPQYVTYGMTYHNQTALARIYIGTDGVVQFVFSSTALLGINTWCPLNMSWRAA